ncbi:MAG: aminotransferase, DegT/DnrJ/EryC1/StrS family [Verrucomicrobia bacterium]|nr:aminotransferase, DegT/DnrJ/EryC1/StrS family [Verrucomicrobiota bacterium]
MVNRTLYCGSPAVAATEWFRRAGSPVAVSRDWPQFRDRQVIATYRGRTAIALACRLLGIGAGDEVLVPAYNCGSEIDPLLHLGASLAGYNVTREGAVDFKDLAARKTSRTKAVYVIHYFGWEQPMADLRKWCDQHGVMLIEDCALSLFSEGQTGAIGQVSDAAIFSLPKTLGFHHGGLLSLSKSHEVKVLALEPPPADTFRREIRTSVRAAAFRALESVGLYGAALSAKQSLGRKPSTTDDGSFPPMPDSYYFDPARHENRSMHPQALLAAGGADWEKIREARRNNYVRLAQALGGVGRVKPLFPKLPERVCPLSLPLVVGDRDRFVEALLRRGIGAYPWWAGYHQKSLSWSHFPDACWLKNNVVTLPIHQQLNGRHLSYISEIVAQFA